MDTPVKTRTGRIRKEVPQSGTFRPVVQILEQCDLFNHGKLFTAAAAPDPQTQPAAIVTAPLALKTIVAGMFLFQKGTLSAVFSKTRA